jgi:hypothetical protein
MYTAARPPESSPEYTRISPPLSRARYPLATPLTMMTGDDAVDAQCNRRSAAAAVILISYRFSRFSLAPMPS